MDTEKALKEIKIIEKHKKKRMRCVGLITISTLMMLAFLIVWAYYSFVASSASVRGDKID